MNKDFLIFSGEWHDSLHCPTREEIPSGVLGQGLLLESHPFFPLTYFVPICLCLCLQLNFSLICAFFIFDDVFFSVFLKILQISMPPF